MDAPLSAIRMGYGDQPSNQTYQPWSEFTVLPLWDVEGGAPFAVFGGGLRTQCLFSGRCLDVWWSLEWPTYGAEQNAFVVSGGTSGTRVWLGEVLQDRQDASRLLYRRNRYYNPEQGRFTQEDPIGLAGGAHTAAAGATGATSRSVASRAFRSLGNGTIERPDLLAEVTTVGRTLRVHEIAYYPKGGRVPTSAGMRATFKALQDEVRELGYEAIELTFHRTRTGHTVTRTIDLTR